MSRDILHVLWEFRPVAVKVSGVACYSPRRLDVYEVPLKKDGKRERDSTPKP